MLIKFLKRFASLGISLGLLALLATGVVAQTDWQKTGDTLLAIDRFWLGLAVLVLWLNFPLNSYRFTLVVDWLTGVRPNFMSTFKITWVSGFIGLSAPFAALGDIARAGLVKWLMQLSLGHAAQTVLFDRGLSMLGFMVLALAFMPWQVGMPLANGFVAAQTGILVALIAGMVIVLVVAQKITWPEGRVSRFIQSCCIQLSAVVSRPERCGRQLLLALCNVLIYAGTMLCLAKGMALELDALNLLLLAPLVLLITNLPIFYMGWGGREATLLMLLAPLAPAGTAESIMALSLAYGVVTIITILPGGVFLIGLKPAAQATQEQVRQKD